MTGMRFRHGSLVGDVVPRGLVFVSRLGHAYLFFFGCFVFAALGLTTAVGFSRGMLVWMFRFRGAGVNDASGPRRGDVWARSSLG
jgi:hypothetical protein